MVLWMTSSPRQGKCEPANWLARGVRMIIVTGATGQLGRAIIQHLVTRIPPAQIGVSVRDPAKAADLAELGVRVRQGDFSDPQSLQTAFEGASQVLLTSSNARASGGDPLLQHRHAIEAARTAGASRIVYTSQMSASPTSHFPPALDHAATEDMLRHSGVSWTALRNGFYANSSFLFLGNALETGLLETPPDGPVAWTTHADLAEGAAAVLMEPGRFEGPTPPLTALQALDFTALTRMASEILGRPIQHTVLPDEAFNRQLAARGLPDGASAVILGMYQASRAGEFATTNPTLSQLLGRPPMTMRAVLEMKINAVEAGESRHERQVAPID